MANEQMLPAARRRWWRRRLLLAAVLAGLTPCAGCHPTAPRVEFANRRFSGALRTATNTKNPQRLAAAKKSIEQAVAAREIGLEEHAWYEEIIALAEAGDWERAERRTIEFRRDQR
ncbi:MAG: hypothetical protein FJ284_00400 [Planctomycetes bacterium]|nr:hypothetical protein [Planctomycetota bacterium]MBM4058094.1 hypothetical protein [Planctomycetota bacterium]